MQAVLLAAGRSSRFTSRGFSPFKCLEMVNGESCLDSTLRFLRSRGVARTVLVTLDGAPIDSDCDFTVRLPDVLPGPAWSAAMATPSLNLAEQTVVADTDGVFLGLNSSVQFPEGSFFVTSEYSGPIPEDLVWVENGQPLFKGYVRGLANTGVYSFSTWETFLRNFSTLETTSPERLVADVLLAVRSRRPPLELDGSVRWLPCGTPEQLVYARSHERP
jgi:hypothetical protein